MLRLFTARAGALALGAMLLAAGQVQAQSATAAAGQGAAAGHGQSHAHDARSVYKGYFDDDQIAQRPLSDWAGKWQSVYPLLRDGTLDPVMAHKAENGGKSQAEHRAHYEVGYRTDVDHVTIDGDRVSFHRGDTVATGTYAPDGYEILTYAAGNRGVRFIFRKVGGDAGAPQVIQFSDHKIAPEVSDHYHLYWGEDRAALLTEVTNWPTYYPAALDKGEIVAEMLAH